MPEDFSNKLTLLMAQNDISRSELAEAIDVSYRAVADYLTKNTIPRQSTLEKIAQFFGVSTNYLIPEHGKPTTKHIGIPFYFTGMTKRNFDNLDEENAGFLPISFHDRPYIVAYRMQGDSMANRYHDGDILFIDFDSEFNFENKNVFGSIRLGKAFLVQLNVDFAGIYIVHSREQDDKLILDKMTTYFPAKVVEPNEIRILGEVVGSLVGSFNYKDLSNLEEYNTAKDYRNPKELNSSIKRKIIFTEWHPLHELEENGDFISHNDKVRMSCAEYMSDFFNRKPDYELIKFEFKSRTQRINRKDQEILYGIRIWYTYPA